MISPKTLQAIRIGACMIAIGYYAGFLYETLFVEGASVQAWTAGIISMIGWFHIFWRVAFCSPRTQKYNKK